MFQKFYEDTLIGRFIKRLIRSTNLPILSIIQHNDYVVQDCYYIHNGYIIHALTSGQFCVDPEKHFGTGTVTAEASTGSGSGRASYEVVDKYDEENKQHSYNFHSRFMYYDPETHYHLGEYLRYIQDTTGLNLFPYYNCFSGKSIDDVCLQKGSKASVNTNSDKILLSPVKYGKTYTIALECNTPVIIQPIIYHSDSGLILKDYKNTLNPRYYSDDLQNQVTLPSSNFLQPTTFTVSNAIDKDLYQQERNLYLAIQVPVDLPDGLVVLEGDYSSSWIRNPLTRVIKSFDLTARHYGDSTDPLFIQNPTLLHFNSNSNIAFSDRLVEYLLLGVIHSEETLDGNTRYLQNLLSTVFEDKSYGLPGIWDDSIREGLYQFSNTNNRQHLLRDLDGHLNKDLEAILTFEADRRE